MNIFFDRMIRAARLDKKLYEDVVVDHDYLNQSIFIIVLSSFSAGITRIATDGISGFILGTVIAFFCWLLWAYLSFFISNLLIPVKEKGIELKEVLRITGFASTPGLIRALGIIPGLLNICFLISSIWMLITMAFAIKHAFDFETIRSVGICLVAGVIQAIIIIIIFL